MRMKTFVVNMPKDKLKLSQIKEQLDKHPELDCIIWEAVEGRKLTKEQQAELILPAFKARYGKSASLPAAGCALSHIGIYRRIVEEDIAYALILEDDCILSNNLMLDAFANLLSKDEPIAILLSPEFWYYKQNRIMDVDHRHSVYAVDCGYMTSGYLINKSAASLLLDHIFPVQFTADAWKDFMSFGLKLYGVVPHLTSYPEGMGEIGKSVITNSPLMRIRAKIIKWILTILSFRKTLAGFRKSSLVWR